jgi:hypothetical protein
MAENHPGYKQESLFYRLASGTLRRSGFSASGAAGRPGVWVAATVITLWLSLGLAWSQNVATGTAGVAFDADGNQYFGTYAEGFILPKRTPAGTFQNLGTVAPSLAGQPITPYAFALAVNGAGDVFYTTPKVSGTVTQAGSISKIDGATGATAIVVDNLNDPAGLAVDGAGNLYYGNYSGGFTLYKLSASGTQSLGQVVPAFTAISRYVFTLAADGAGNVFYTTPSLSGQPGTISEIGSTTGVVVGNLHSPAGLACDSLGNLFFGDYNGGWVLYARAAGWDSQELRRRCHRTLHPNSLRVQFGGASAIELLRSWS